MALVKPKIEKQIVAFNANNSNTFEFVVDGGTQIQKNTMIIRNSENVIVYRNTVIRQETTNIYEPYQNPPLINGERYIVSFITYDENDNRSEESDGAVFYCYSDPHIYITNIPEQNKIPSVSYNFKIKYEQLENEKLNSFIIELYDGSGNLIKATESFSVEKKSWTYSGFENNRNYKIKIYAETENGTKFESEDYNFLVVYEEPTLYSLLEVENVCNGGYVQLNTNLIIIDGKPNKKPIYNNGTLYLEDEGSNVIWDENFEVGDNFSIEIWMSVNNFGNICILKNKDGEETLTLSFERTKINNVYKDFVLLKNNKESNKFIMASNLIDDTLIQEDGTIGSSSKIIIWFSKQEDDYYLNLDLQERVDNRATWNEYGNIEYNKLSNITYSDEKPTVTSEYPNNNLSNLDIFPINYIEIMNGNFYHINIIKSIYKIGKETIYDSYPHSDLIPEWNNIPKWDFQTVLDCDFNNNINGGNFSISLDKINYVCIKRREYGKTSWTAILKKKINVSKDLNIIYQDNLAPNNKVFEYAIMPLYYDGTEGEYEIKSVKSLFKDLFIAESNKIFKIDSGVAYSDTTRNREIGNLQPIGRKYPIIIENSEIDYLSGNLVGRLCGYDFSKNRSSSSTEYVNGDMIRNYEDVINRFDIVKQTEDFTDFLTNGNCKIIKDWNGNIWMVRLSESPTISSDISNGITNVSFNWIEQGKWDKQEDLEENGFL